MIKDWLVGFAITLGLLIVNLGITVLLCEVLK